MTFRPRGSSDVLKNVLRGLIGDDGFGWCPAPLAHSVLRSTAKLEFSLYRKTDTSQGNNSSL